MVNIRRIIKGELHQIHTTESAYRSLEEDYRMCNNMNEVWLHRGLCGV